MDGLRERRRHRNNDRTSGPTPDSSSRSPSSSPNCPHPKRFSLTSVLTVLLILQSTLLLFLLFLYSRPSKSSAPRLVNSLTTSSASPVVAHPTYDVFITVYAYDRPRHLLHLLHDIAREADATSLKIGLNVIDDNSLSCVFPPTNSSIFDEASSSSSSSSSSHLHLLLPTTPTTCSARTRFHHVESFLATRAWSLYVAPYRHARRRYWHLVRMAHALLKNVQSRYFLFLPDDDRLALQFFPRVIDAWERINDARKLTLMLHIEESREFEAVWTPLKPRAVGDGLFRIGWVESGNFLCTQHFLSFVNWSFPRVSPQRWIDNPPISSGVGAVLSDMIHSAGKRMYRTEVSFVAHVGVSLSKMNSKFRERNVPTLMTKYFADGKDEYEKMIEEAATVTVSIASVWTREAALHSTVYSLADQVDHLNVYLNGYESVPVFLLVPYVTVIRSDDKGAKGDIGDIGKFFWSNEITTEFHFTADDDIVYPGDYVTKMVSFWRSYDSPVVVGVHGIRIIDEALNPRNGRKGKGYYGSRQVWMGTENVSQAVNVHIIGTGTMMYRPEDIGYLDLEKMFPERNMADIWFGIIAQRLKLPMIVIPHVEGWIKEVDGTFEDSIYSRSTRSRTSDRLQSKAAQGVGSWNIYNASCTIRI